MYSGHIFSFLQGRSECNVHALRATTAAITISRRRRACGIAHPL
jgi:hypothetical protein